MGPEIVSDYHFGGGLLKKVNESDQPRRREEIMKEVIAKSKFYRDQHQREREESLALTEELDKDLTNLIPHLAGFFKRPGDKQENNDDFDVLAKELAFEPRAKPLERLPTAEELAQKQRDRLELLEKERKRRMNPESFENEEEAEEAEEEEENEAGNEEDDEEDIEDSENEGKPRKNKRESKNDEEFDDDYRPDDRQRRIAKKTNKPSLKNVSKAFSDREILLIEANTKEDAIPFFIEAPDTLEDFNQLFNDKTPNQIKVIVARILVANNPTLGSAFKRKILVYILKNSIFFFSTTLFFKN